MINRLVSFALYGLPATLVLLSFMLGHSSIKPEQDRLQAPNEIGLDNIEADVDETENDTNQNSDASSEDDPALTLGTPGFQYYPYPSTIIGNVPNSTKLFSFEIAVAIYDTSLAANVMITTLEEREPQLRPLILENAVDLDENVLLSKDGRLQLKENIKKTINDYLARWGYEPFIHAVEITSFIIT